MDFKDRYCSYCGLKMKMKKTILRFDSSTGEPEYGIKFKCSHKWYMFGLHDCYVKEMKWIS